MTGRPCPVPCAHPSPRRSCPSRPPAQIGPLPVLVFLAVGTLGAVLLAGSLVRGEFLGDLVERIAHRTLPPWLTGMFCGTLLAGFGYSAALYSNLQFPLGLDIVLGLLSAGAVAAVVSLIGHLIEQGRIPEPRRAEHHLTGRTGHVVTTIPVDGQGAVSVVVAGRLVKIRARAPQELPAGTPVTVIDMADHVADVEPIAS